MSGLNMSKHAMNTEERQVVVDLSLSEVSCGWWCLYLYEHETVLFVYVCMYHRLECWPAFISATLRTKMYIAHRRMDVMMSEVGEKINVIHLYFCHNYNYRNPLWAFISCIEYLELYFYKQLKMKNQI